MIKRLQRKFILINMTLIGIVLIVVFSVLLYVNHNKYVNDSIGALSRIVDSKETQPMIPEIKNNFDEKAPPSDSLFFASFWVKLGADGSILSSKMNNISISDDTLKKLVKLVQKNDSLVDTIPSYQLRYMKKTFDSQTILAFVSTKNETSAMNSLIIISAVSLLGALLAFLIISFFLSKWALAPVQKAWTQQKQFIADASHELKTPLTVILANQEILLTSPDQTIQEQRKWIESSSFEGKRMKNLIEDMLFLAKNDVQKSQQDFQTINLSDLILNRVLLFESLAFEQGIELQTQIEDSIFMSGHSSQLIQLFSILLDNACKYSPAKSMISIQLYQDHKIHFLIKNPGPPIPKEDLPHIFDRFYRSDKSREFKGNGYGLGLSIASSIVDVHHGKINVTSNEIEGTTFHIIFPTCS